MTETERNTLFEQLLEKALADPEVSAALRQERAPSAARLETAARERRDHILGQARVAEDDYRAAQSALQAEIRRARTDRITLVAGGLMLVLLLIWVGIASAWPDLLKKAHQARPYHDPSVGSILGSGLETALGYVIILGPPGVVIWWLIFLLWPLARSGDDGARKVQAWASVGVPGAMLGLAALGTGGAMSEVVWRLVHHGSATGPQGRLWSVLASAGAVVLFVAAAAPLGSLLGERLPRILGGQVSRRMDPTAVEANLVTWRSALHEALLSFLRGEISGRMTRRYGTVLHLLEDSRGLRQVRGAPVYVVTPAALRLAALADGMDNGSIALSGPRGAGKTALLSAFCENEPRARAGLVLHVPVVFDRREFMLHLFDSACTFAIAEELKAQRDARERLEWIRYLQTRSKEVTAGAGWKGFTLGGKRGTSKVRQPLTYPEIVDRLRDFLTTVAREVQDGGRRLVIGIDELDRIEPAERARDFLSELKVLFDVQNCLYVLSVSDEALREAGLARPRRRDAFDSAVDEVVRVEPLTCEYAVRLLGTRAIGLPEPFTALFHCLSGGMPRELLRTARAAATQTSSDRPCRLSEMTAYLVSRDVQRGVEEEPVTHARFRDTLLQIFTDDLTPEQLHQASDPAFPGSFDALAAVQRGLTDPAADHARLDKIRQAWRLPV